MLHSQFTKVFS